MRADVWDALQNKILFWGGGGTGGRGGVLGVFGVDSDTTRQHELEWVPGTGVGPHGFVLFFSTFYVCLKAPI